MQTRAIGCVVWFAMLGCPQQTPTTSPVDTPPVDTTSVDTTSVEPAVRTCSDDPPAFVSLAWVPPQARAVTHLQLDDPDLDASIEHVVAAAADTRRELPIRTAFSLGQWKWQIPLLRTTLAQAGFAPSALVHVMLPDGTSAWAWPPACDLEQVRTNVANGWGLTLRNTAYGAIARAAADDGESAFAYDFVAWGASANLLVPAGRATTTTQLLGAPREASTTVTPSDLVLGLADAPVRLAVRVDDLLASQAEASADATITTHRVDAEGWHTLE